MEKRRLIYLGLNTKRKTFIYKKLDEMKKIVGVKAFFILVDNHYAGFVLTNTGKEKSVIEEFWIMPKYRKGMFAFEVLKKVLFEMHGKIEFVILNKNERWLKVVDYLIRKNYQVLSMENIKKWETEDFTKYTILSM